MPNTRSTSTFSVSGQGLGRSPSHSVNNLPINRNPFYTVSLTNDNKKYYSGEYITENYDSALAEFNRLVESGIGQVFQINIVKSEVFTTYGGLLEDSEADYYDNTIQASTANSSEISLTGYTFSKYGKGFLLHPRDGEADQYYGQKYFLEGWWNQGQNAWFFRKDSVRMLEELGATCDTPTRNKSRKRIGKSVSVLDLNGYYYKPYGRGFMLYPQGPEGSDPLFGQKYLLSGSWNHRARGWFFQTKFEDEFIAHGAVRSHAFEELVVLDESESEDPDYSPEDEALAPVPEEEYYEDPEELEEHDEEEDLDGMYFLRYGKGYILKTKKTDPRYGTKYFLDGFWNAKAKGWFFKREMKRFLKEHGAKYIKLKA